jgi:hypothetical protein
MTRGVRVYLVGSLVLVALAGCGRSFMQFAEREPWRREAEVECLKSGSVKESPAIVRAEPIEGPGICGADFPLKVAALGENPSYGFADELRPPGAIPRGATQPRWPVAQPRYEAPVAGPRYNAPPAEPRYAPAPGEPISLRPPGLAEPEPYPQRPSYGAPQPSAPDTRYVRPYPEQQNALPAPRSGSDPYAVEGARSNRPPVLGAPPRTLDEQRYGPPREEPARTSHPPSQSLPALGPARGLVTASTGPAAVKPAATLACPLVSALDRWIADAVQPAAQKWFGQQVAEIRQISAYSCRGMNGQPGARISEHAFGNALDISGFLLADGRKITVKDGWRGMPEEQGFLRDVQAAACNQFNTVLAPGSNRFHYDHIHVDLMRRGSGRRICNPNAEDGELVAARATGQRGMYARRGDPGVTGSLASKQKAAPKRFGRSQAYSDEEDWVEDEPQGRDD